MGSRLDGAPDSPRDWEWIVWAVPAYAERAQVAIAAAFHWTPDTMEALDLERLFWWAENAEARLGDGRSNAPG